MLLSICDYFLTLLCDQICKNCWKADPSLSTSFKGYEKRYRRRTTSSNLYLRCVLLVMEVPLYKTKNNKTKMKFSFIYFFPTSHFMKAKKSINNNKMKESHICFEERHYGCWNERAFRSRLESELSMKKTVHQLVSWQLFLQLNIDNVILSISNYSCVIFKHFLKYSNSVFR